MELDNRMLSVLRYAKKCAECKFYRPQPAGKDREDCIDVRIYDYETATCGHEKARNLSPNAVLLKMEFFDCDIMRAYKSECGTDAKLFEAMLPNG